MTDATKKLIEELRSTKNDFPSYLHSLCKVAADEIERLSINTLAETNLKLAQANARIEKMTAQQRCDTYDLQFQDGQLDRLRQLLSLTLPLINCDLTPSDSLIKEISQELGPDKIKLKPESCFAPVSPESARLADWP
jgi:hypothetical protein